MTLREDGEKSRADERKQGLSPSLKHTHTSRDSSFVHRDVHCQRLAIQLKNRICSSNLASQRLLLLLLTSASDKCRSISYALIHSTRSYDSNFSLSLSLFFRIFLRRKRIRPPRNFRSLNDDDDDDTLYYYHFLLPSE